MIINRINLKFVLKTTKSTIDDLVEWLKLIKKECFYIGYPCIRGKKYLGKYSFYDKEEWEYSDKSITNRAEDYDIYVGSIIRGYENNYVLWDKIRENDDLFNELISTLEMFENEKN